VATKKAVVRASKPEKKGWSEKIGGKQKREERREKRKAVKDEFIRRKREAEWEKEFGEMQEELEEDWKEPRRERKRAKKEKGNGVKTEATVQSSIPNLTSEVSKMSAKRSSASQNHNPIVLLMKSNAKISFLPSNTQIHTHPQRWQQQQRIALS